MSKLSDKVEEDRKKSKLTLAVEKDKAFKDELCSFLYDEVSELDFKSYNYKDDKAYFLHILAPISGKIPIVKILYGERTTDYKVTLVDSKAFTPDSIVRLSNADKDVYELKDLHNDKNEFVDIGELLFYCERHSEDIKQKERLNEELDKGFTRNNVPPKYRDTIIKGFDDDDVAYNEALHRRLRGRF